MCRGTIRLGFGKFVHTQYSVTISYLLKIFSVGPLFVIALNSGSYWFSNKLRNYNLKNSEKFTSDIRWCIGNHFQLPEQAMIWDVLNNKNGGLSVCRSNLIPKEIMKEVLRPCWTHPKQSHALRLQSSHRATQCVEAIDIPFMSSFAFQKWKITPDFYP